MIYTRFSAYYQHNNRIEYMKNRLYHTIFILILACIIEGMVKTNLRVTQEGGIEQSWSWKCVTANGITICKDCTSLNGQEICRDTNTTALTSFPSNVSTQISTAATITTSTFSTSTTSITNFQMGISHKV